LTAGDTTGTLDGTEQRLGLKQAAQQCGVELLTREHLDAWMTEPREATD
jgi:hypothetical protein